MPSMGGMEWAIVLVIVIIVFGVGKLPEVGGALGRAIREFRESSSKPEITKEAPEGQTKIS